MTLRPLTCQQRNWLQRCLHNQCTYTLSPLSAPTHTHWKVYDSESWVGSPFSNAVTRPSCLACWTQKEHVEQRAAVNLSRDCTDLHLYYIIYIYKHIYNIILLSIDCPYIYIKHKKYRKCNIPDRWIEKRFHEVLPDKERDWVNYST